MSFITLALIGKRPVSNPTLLKNEDNFTTTLAGADILSKTQPT